MSKRYSLYRPMLLVVSLSITTVSFAQQGIHERIPAPNQKSKIANMVPKLEQMIVDIQGFVEQLAEAKRLYEAVMKPSQQLVAECRTNGDEEFIMEAAERLNKEICDNQKNNLKKKLYSVAITLKESESFEEEMVVAAQQIRMVLRRAKISGVINEPLDKLDRELSKLTKMRTNLENDMTNNGVMP